MNIFIVPVPLVQITVLENVTLGTETLRNFTIGDPLTLDCTVTAVRGISSSVDIIWTTGGSAVRRVDNITVNIENDHAIYTDSFEISSLSVFDNGKEYQCTVVINANQPVDSSDQITIIFPGKYTYVYIYMYVSSICRHGCYLIVILMYICVCAIVPYIYPVFILYLSGKLRITCNLWSIANPNIHRKCHIMRLESCNTCLIGYFSFISHD